MATEIERKFLVRSKAYRKNSQAIVILQGFLSTDKHRVVRIRICGEKAYLTIKGKSKGASRKEFEYPIPVADATVLINELCIQPVITKTRYIYNAGHLNWEIDEFEGDNMGLTIAEVEIPVEDFKIDLPDWVGVEVTHDPRYYNANLIVNPYCNWKDQDSESVK